MIGNARWPRLIAAVCAAAGALGASAPTALGAVTSSNVSSPSGPYLTDHGQAVTVTGTVRGNPGDGVDLNCYAGGSWRTLKSGVTVQDDRTFTYTGPLAPIDDQTCVLRAVPSGTSPSDLARFTGPTLGIGKVQNELVSTGQNSGALAYYDLFAAQRAGAFHYLSLGGCTIWRSFVYDPGTLASAPLDYCNGGFWWRDGYPGRTGFFSPNRSEMEVDGADAYLAGQLTNMGSFATQNPGFPSVSYGYSIDPATGNLALDETDQVVACSPQGATFPPTTTSCTKFVPTGIQVRLRVEQGQNGRVASVTQYFTSTDGASHSIDLLEDNEFSHPSSDGRLNFPWTGAGLQAYQVPGQVISGPGGSGPGSFFIKGSAAAPDGGQSSAQGAVSFSNPPDSAQIIGTTDNSSGFSWVDLHYARTVPAGGAIALGFTYSNAFLAGETSSDAGAAEAAFRPSVSIASPASGATTSQPSVVVAGSAGDARQLTSLTVDGVAQSVTNGSWSTTVPLSPGPNTITVVGTNLFGNTTQTLTTVNYTPPVPLSPSPALSHVSQTHRTWRESGRPGRGRPPIGTTIALTLNMPARVSFTFTRPAAGRRVHGKCLAPTRRNLHRRFCSRAVTAGTVSFSANSGRNVVKFYGALSRRQTLRPGRYTLLISATDPLTGRTSATRRLSFKIVG